MDFTSTSCQLWLYLFGHLFPRGSKYWLHFFDQGYFNLLSQNSKRRPVHVFNFQSSYNSDNSGRNIFLILTLKSWIIIFKITFILNQSRVKQCQIAGTSGSCLNCINPVKFHFQWLFPALYFVTSQPGKIFDAKIQRSEQNNVIGAISDFWRSLCSFDFHNVLFWFSLRTLVILRSRCLGCHAMLNCLSFLTARSAVCDYCCLATLTTTASVFVISFPEAAILFVSTKDTNRFPFAP